MADGTVKQEISGLCVFEHIRTLDYKGPQDEVRKLYDKWAETYQKDSDVMGYIAGVKAAKGFLALADAKQFPKSVRIVDIGAGTGKIAETIKEHGFVNIDAVDISPNMLKVAEEQGLYKNYICKGIGTEPLPIASETYDIATAAGAFSRGHIGASGLDEFARLVKKGGFMIWTLRTEVYDKDISGFREKIDELCEKKIWTVEQKTKTDLYSNAEENDILRYCYLIICKKL